MGPSSIIVVTPWRCISTWAIVTAGEPGPTTLRTLGIDSVPKPKRGDAGRAVDTEHVAQTELAADDEHGGIDLAAATRNRRHDERELRHSGDDRRHRQLVGDARIAGLARRREQSRRDTGVNFSPTVRPGSASKLQSAVRESCCSLNARRWAMASSIAASTAGSTTACENSSSVTRSPSGSTVDAVVARQRIAHRRVAALAHVVDQLADRSPQPRVEDLVEPAGAQPVARLLRHVGPPLATHHRHRRHGSGGCRTVPFRECPSPSSSAPSGATRARRRSSTCSPRSTPTSCATRAGTTPGTPSSSATSATPSSSCRAVCCTSTSYR